RIGAPPHPPAEKASPQATPMVKAGSATAPIQKPVVPIEPALPKPALPKPALPKPALPKPALPKPAVAVQVAPAMLSLPVQPPDSKPASAPPLPPLGTMSDHALVSCPICRHFGRPAEVMPDGRARCASCQAIFVMPDTRAAKTAPGIVFEHR